MRTTINTVGTALILRDAGGTTRSRSWIHEAAAGLEDIPTRMTQLGYLDRGTSPPPETSA